MKLVILSKGRKLPEGSIRTWKDGIKRKKVNGKWIPVKKGKRKAIDKVKPKTKKPKPVSVFDELAKVMGVEPYEIRDFCSQYNVFIPENGAFKTIKFRDAKPYSEEMFYLPDMGYKWLDVFKEAFHKDIDIYEAVKNFLKRDYGFDAQNDYEFETKRLPYQDWSESKQLNMLKNGKIVEMHRNPATGVNFSYIVILKNKKGETMDAIFKPKIGEVEAPRNNIPKQTQYIRETAGYEVSKALGLNIVPPTVIRDGGSMQMIVGGATELFKADTSDIREEINIKRFEIASVFDYLIYNNDRHLGNILMTDPPKGLYAGYKDFVLIDHGYSFPMNEIGFRGDDYGLLNSFTNNSVHGEYKISKELMHKVNISKEKLTDIGVTLRKIGIDRPSVNGFIRRILNLKKNKVIPPMVDLK